MTLDEAVRKAKIEAQKLQDRCESPHCESGCPCQCEGLGGAARYLPLDQIALRIAPRFLK